MGGILDKLQSLYKHVTLKDSLNNEISALERLDSIGVILESLDKRVVCMGKVVGFEGGILKIKALDNSNLKVTEHGTQKTQSINTRIYYRQEVNLIGTLIVDNRASQCQVRNISGGGICIDSTITIPPEKTIRVEVKLLNSFDAFSFRCQIRQIRNINNTIEYGCEFTGLSESEQERLFKAILEMQRNMVGPRR